MEQYEKALTAFIELGEYKDSKRKIADIDSVLQARAEIEDIRSLGIELDNFIGCAVF